MQRGELTVTGQDFAIIKLTGFPSKVDCFFKDQAVLVPCNPHHYDEVECEVHVSNTSLSGYVLKVMWTVTGVREVVFRVYY